MMERYDADQPWVIYRYGATHDKWWPFWSSTRVLGFAKVECECAICGERHMVKAPILGTALVATMFFALPLGGACGAARMAGWFGGSSR